jgi:nucleoside phosphorylase
VKSIPVIVVGYLLASPFFVLADTAVLVALPSEQTALSREVRIVGQPVELAQHKISIGYHKGEKLYIVRTGAGNLNSAMVTQALLTRYRIDRVISIGVAGNLADGKGEAGSGKGEGEARGRIGDLFIATEVVSHQEGKETPGGFEAKEKLASSRSGSEEYDRRCAELRSNAVEIARALLGDTSVVRTNETTEIPRQARNDTHSVHQGRLVSGDSFIASTAKRKWLRETFHADAVDMVSVGIARVCEANGVPYVIIRVLSDNADESASAAFASFVQNYKEPVTASIALAVVERVTAGPPTPLHQPAAGETNRR